MHSKRTRARILHVQKYKKKFDYIYIAREN